MAVVPFGTLNGSSTKLLAWSWVNEPVITCVGAGAPQLCGGAARAPGAAAGKTRRASQRSTSGSLHARPVRRVTNHLHGTRAPQPEPRRPGQDPSLDGWP